MKQMSWEDWKKRVDAYLVRETGMTADDLPDCCYRDWYDDGVAPILAAKRAIKNGKES